MRQKDPKVANEGGYVEFTGLENIWKSHANKNLRPLIWMLPKESWKLFLWKNKTDKIKRSRIYQDLDSVEIRMIDFDIMLKALKFAWIPRLLRTSKNSTWCIILQHYFRRMGGLNLNSAQVQL